jgi:hypothetical protein
MSALGQKQTSRHVRVMSALPPEADIRQRIEHVRYVPIADIFIDCIGIEGVSFLFPLAIRQGRR